MWYIAHCSYQRPLPVYITPNIQDKDKTFWAYCLPSSDTNFLDGIVVSPCHSIVALTRLFRLIQFRFVWNPDSGFHEVINLIIMPFFATSSWILICSFVTWATDIRCPNMVLVCISRSRMFVAVSQLSITCGPWIGSVYNVFPLKGKCAVWIGSVCNVFLMMKGKCAVWIKGRVSKKSHN